MKTKISKSSRKACAAQHFGVWCVDEQWHRDTFAAVKSGLFKPQVEEVGAPPLTYENIGGTAVIAVDGMLTKGKSSFGGTSMMELAAVIREADKDIAIREILYEIDSPGGTYGGIELLCNAMKRTSKRQIAKVSDWAASGALWMAVHADEIVLNRNGKVGSIGAFTVLLDTSKANEQEGLNPILVSSGELKGAGADGRIKPELVAEIQKGIDQVTAQFIGVISEQRGLTVEQVRNIADGRMFSADESLQLGLVDRVIDESDAETFLEQEIAMTREEFMSHASQHPTDLKEAAKGLISTEVEQALTAAKPKPASITDLETVFPDEEKFVISQFKAGATIEQAKLAHASKIASELESLKQKNASLQSEIAKLDPGRAGRTDPVQTGQPDNTNDPKPMTPERRKQLLAMAGV